MVNRSIALSVFLIGTALARLARAEAETPHDEATAEAPPPSPAVHHAPVVATASGEDIVLDAAFEHPDRLKRALLVWRGTGGAGEAQFQRSSKAKLPWVAVIPASFVRGEEVSYAIELETTSGARVPAFATRTEPHRVTVLDAADDAREAAYLRRLGGRRSEVRTWGEFVSFGTTDAVVATPRGNEPRSVRDQYYRVEGSYTYRFLGVVSEFGIRAGAVRGSSLVPGEVDPAKYDVGLNYGAPRVRLRATDWLHLEAELLTSVTEIGFSGGGGGAVLLGDAYGSKVVFGGEVIQVFGSRLFTRLDLVASRRLVVSPVVEVTNMPHADRAGIRLASDAGIDLGAGVRLDLRAGYQARAFNQGGPSIGAGLAYAF
jgi:hypothetical protein